MKADPFILDPSTDRDYVTLLVRDPDWAYVFWEATAEGVTRSKSRLSNAGTGCPMVLRIYSFERDNKAGRSKAEFAEYEVDQWLGGRLVLLGRPGTFHQAVLGFKGEGETFSPLCRSPLVPSPQLFGGE
ncbi:MAG: DUF4912 domain-containing protein [Bradymonadales bacterium]|nr:DUF4912 domain-containing protein [Bradymonadales bacterium]